MTSCCGAPAGKPTLVLAEGGRLVNADVLTEGDEVSVFGLPGEAPDLVGIAGARRTGAAVSAPRFARVRSTRCSSA